MSVAGVKGLQLDVLEILAHPIKPGAPFTALMFALDHLAFFLSLLSKR
jgi:hypothetical protein